MSSVFQPTGVLRPLSRVAACAAFAATTLVQSSSSLSSAERAVDRLGLPRVVLWAWERPERIEGLDPERTGVAFLARTYQLADDDIVTRPRLNPLTVTPGTPMMAVARIETERVRRPRFSRERTTWLAREIAALGAMPNVRAVQIDFDATVSERAFYRELIAATRAALGDRTPLSITALASWCMGDAWIDEVPIDEAVPMLFRMGANEDGQFRRAGESNAWRASKCRTSLGISTDEPIARPRDARRVYVFHPAAWTRQAVAAAILTP